MADNEPGPEYECAKVELALVVGCNESDAPLDEATEFDFSITPLVKPPEWDADTGAFRVVIGSRETAGHGNVNTVDTLVSLLASRLGSQLEGTGVRVEAYDGSTIPTGESGSDCPVAKLVFECVEAVDVAWNYSKIRGWAWGVPGYSRPSRPTHAMPVTPTPTNTAPPSTSGRFPKPRANPSSPWPKGWAPVIPPPSMPPIPQPPLPPDTVDPTPPPPRLPRTPVHPGGKPGSPGGKSSPHVPAQPGPELLPGLKGGGWKRLTLGICLGPTAGLGFPGPPPRWVTQCFVVPATWSQARMMAHVAAEWALDDLRPLYFERAPLVSVMWGVDAAPDVESGRIHMDLNVRHLWVRPVDPTDPAMADHTVKKSAPSALREQGRTQVAAMKRRAPGGEGPDSCERDCSLPGSEAESGREARLSRWCCETTPPTRE